MVKCLFMKKKYITTILIVCFSLFSSTTYSQNESERIKADAAAAGSYHATAVSMVFWGVLLVAGIAAAAILINSSHSE